MGQNKTFTIKALKECAEFLPYKDVISALFISQEKATKEEVREAIDEYLNKEVK